MVSRPLATVARGVSLSGLLATFGDVALVRAKPRQVRAMVATARGFLFRMGIRSAAEITPAMVQEYLAELLAAGKAAKTIWNHRSAISAFCKFLKLRGIIQANPCKEVLGPKLEETIPRWLEESEVRQALQIARQHGIFPEVMLALTTGLRLGELARLWWADISFERRTLTVRKSKIRKPRVVPLSQAATGALLAQKAVSGEMVYVFPARKTYRGGWKWVDKERCPNTWKHLIRPLKEAIPKFRTIKGTGEGWHLFRHTFASRYAQAGGSIFKLSRFLGHSSVQTTEKFYAHLRPGFDEENELAAGTDYDAQGTTDANINGGFYHNPATAGSGLVHAGQSPASLPHAISAHYGSLGHDNLYHSGDLSHDPHTDTDNRPRYYVLAFIERIR